jgi:hypothetical protein
MQMRIHRLKIARKGITITDRNQLLLEYRQTPSDDIDAFVYLLFHDY